MSLFEVFLAYDSWKKKKKAKKRESEPIAIFPSPGANELKSNVSTSVVYAS